MEFNNEEAGCIGIEKSPFTIFETSGIGLNARNITRILATTTVIVGLEEMEKGHGFSLSSLYFKGIFSVDGVNPLSMVLETDLVSLNERSLKLIKVIASTTGHGFNLDSRKSQAWRRYQATKWLKSFVGSVGILKQPSEKEFISCLRKGLILCNAINEIQPGSVPRYKLYCLYCVLYRCSIVLYCLLIIDLGFENLLKAVEGLNLPILERLNN
ncbi:hypothetical protein LXL04_037118 [Taraxacum kok-saghyz]